MATGKPPRLGAAAVSVTISDDDGFRVCNGEGDDLVHIPADKLEPGDWQAFWNGIQDLQMRVLLRNRKT